MKSLINKVNITICVLLVIHVSSVLSQINADIYTDEYFFSYENSKKSVIIHTRLDTMIDVWIDGVKDTAKYLKDRHDNSFESEDNGVGYLIELTESGMLNVSSVEDVFGGNDFQFSYPIKANTFGSITMYDCSKFRQIPYWNALMTDLKPEQIRTFNNTAYYLQQLGNEKCNNCAISLLEDIIKISPKRIVAYLNLGDAYWAKEEKDKAIENYNKYIELMKEKGWEGKTPKKVIERLSQN